MQAEFLADVKSRLTADSRVAAAWLAGSYGRGDADRWSDIDLHLLLAPGDGTWRAAAQAWLADLRPLVLFKWMFDGRMINALTADGLRIDLWLHDDPPTLDPARVHVLFDKDVRLHFAAAAPAAVDEAQVAAALRGQIEEFWRCIALTPTVIGRRELLVAFMGLDVEMGLALEICLRGNGIVREAGVKKLNQYLPVELRRQLETAIALDGMNPPSLAAAHLRLAEVIRQEGRRVAARWGFDYPAQLEQAVLAYVNAELEQILAVDTP